MKKKNKRSGTGESGLETTSENTKSESTKSENPSPGDAPPEKTKSGETVLEETVLEETVPDDAKELPAAAPRKSLPAFGFAADLLKKASAPQPQDAPASESAEAMVSEPLVADAAPELESRLPAAGDIDAHAPTRVFDFADGLGIGSRPQEEAAPVKIGTYVAFDLAGETYAMPVEPVRQVVRVSTITRVPHAPRPIRGVTNLRGRVIPVIDLRLRLGLPETQVARSSRVVAVASRGRLIGLLVDAVHQVVHLDLFKVQPPPDDVMTLQSDYIEGVYGEGDDLILLLDIDKALIIREAGAA